MSLSHAHELSRVQVGEHQVAVQYFGGGPPEPGWYLYEGFRSSVSDTPICGPCPNLPALLREAAWRHAEAAYLSTTSTHRSVYGDLLAIQARHDLNGLFNRGAYAQPVEGVDLFEPFVVIAPEHLRLMPPVRIDSFVKLECGGGMLIGQHVHIASFCHLGIGGGRVILEDGSSCGSGARIISGSNTYGPGHGCSAIDPAAAVERSFVHVKKNATLYAGATVLPGVTIGENAVIAAHALVREDVGDYEIWAGVPARKVGRMPRP